MKIVMLDSEIMGEELKDWEGFDESLDVTIYDYTPAELTVERIGDAEIIIVDKTVISEEVLEKCPSIKFIAVLATGYNIVDTAAARKRNIPVANVPGYASDIVAQSTMALILEIYNQVGAYNRSVHNGDWINSKYFCYTIAPIYELKGKTLGILGFGSIGQAVGKLAQAFGMKVLAYSRTVHKELENENCHYVDLDTMLEKSDIVTVHCPLFEETEGIINKKTIEKMKDGAVLINTSRGQCVNEADLAEALNSGKLMAAGLDVLCKEPMDKENPLFTAKNCIFTPHVAWASNEAIQKIKDVTYENIYKFLRGEEQNIVN